jgi:hypothetical protein
MTPNNMNQFEINTLLRNFDETVIRSGSTGHGDEEEHDDPPVQG